MYAIYATRSGSKARLFTARPDDVSNPGKALSEAEAQDAAEELEAQGWTTEILPTESLPVSDPDGP